MLTWPQEPNSLDVSIWLPQLGSLDRLTRPSEQSSLDGSDAGAETFRWVDLMP